MFGKVSFMPWLNPVPPAVPALLKNPQSPGHFLAALLFGKQRGAALADSLAMPRKNPGQNKPGKPGKPGVPAFMQPAVAGKPGKPGKLPNLRDIDMSGGKQPAAGGWRNQPGMQAFVEANPGAFLPVAPTPTTSTSELPAEVSETPWGWIAGGAAAVVALVAAAFYFGKRKAA